MTKSNYSETLDFLDGIMYSLKEDGRYDDFYNNTKNLKSLNKLREGANLLLESMPVFD